MNRYPFDTSMLRGGPPLSEDALDTAVEAATAAAAAGLDEASQLEHGIRAYLAVGRLIAQSRSDALREAFPFLPKD